MEQGNWEVSTTLNLCLGTSKKSLSLGSGSHAFPAVKDEAINRKNNHITLVPFPAPSGLLPLPLFRPLFLGTLH